MIDDGFICFSLYTVVNTFLLSENGVCRKIDDVWNMNSNCSAFKSIEGQYCKANTELLPEELVNFAIGINGLSTKHLPADVQSLNSSAAGKVSLQERA